LNGLKRAESACHAEGRLFESGCPLHFSPLKSLLMIKDNVILVIDQNLNRRNNLSARFRMQGYAVEFVSSGLQALNYLEENVENKSKGYKLVLIMEDSEDMPGREIMLLMREIIPKKSDLPILMANKDNDPTVIIETIQEGANDYIVDLQNEGKIMNKVLKFAPLPEKK